jgi:hypothetical protein
VFSRAFNVMMNLLFRTDIADHQCGFKIVDRGALERLFPLLRSDHFLFDAELIANAKFLRIPVCPIEIDWLEEREDGDSRISSPRVILMMLIDMALLRLSFLGNRRLLTLRQMYAGRLTEFRSGKSLTAEMTVIDTTHRRILGWLRKFYLSIAFDS